MSTLFSNKLSCFFCQSLISPLPHDPRSFRCQTCGCYNRYDHNGEILSDEPAMHDEALNSRSFAKRASPSKDRLPTIYGHLGPFCHTCQTNQMLLVNLLSNYLPPPDVCLFMQLAPSFQSILLLTELRLRTTATRFAGISRIFTNALSAGLPDMSSIRAGRDSEEKRDDAVDGFGRVVK
jgi:hypothetical protein